MPCPNCDSDTKAICFASLFATPECCWMCRRMALSCSSVKWVFGPCSSMVNSFTDISSEFIVVEMTLPHCQCNCCCSRWLSNTAAHCLFVSLCWHMHPSKPLNFSWVIFLTTLYHHPYFICYIEWSRVCLFGIG